MSGRNYLLPKPGDARASVSNTVVKATISPPACSAKNHTLVEWLPSCYCCQKYFKGLCERREKRNRWLWRPNYWRKDTCILMKILFTDQSAQETHIPMGFPIAYLQGIPLFIVTLIKKLIADKFITHRVHRYSVIFGCVFLYSALFLTISDKSLGVPIIVILMQIAWPQLDVNRKKDKLTLC